MPFIFPDNWQNDPAMFKAVVEGGQFALTAIATLVGGLWTANRWLNELKERRLALAREADAERRQKRAEARKQRRDTVAALVRDFCAAEDDQKRLAFAVALSGYQRDALPLLLLSLPHLQPDAARSLELVIAAGPPATLEKIAEMNRLGRRIREAEREASAMLAAAPAGAAGDGPSDAAPAPGTEGAAPGSATPAVPPSDAQRMVERTRSVIGQIAQRTCGDALKGVDAGALDLCELRLGRLGLDGARLEGTLLHGASFQRSSLVGASLAGAALDGTRFTGAVLTGAGFRAAKGEGANFVQADLRNADLRDAAFTRSHFEGTRLGGAKLDGVRMTECLLGGADLPELEVENATLVRGNWKGASLRGTRLKASYLQRGRFEGAQMDGMSAVKCRFNASTFVGARLRDAELTACELGGCTFKRCELGGARFVRCNLGGAGFDAACVLRGAEFRACNLGAADLEHVSLQGVCFKGNTRWSERTRIDAAAALRDAEFGPGAELFREWLQARAEAAAAPEKVAVPALVGDDAPPAEAPSA